MSVTVLGAGGGAGGAITAELVGRGHLVTAVTRRGDAAVPDGVRVAAADLYDPQEFPAFHQLPEEIGMLSLTAPDVHDGIVGVSAP
jgi:uncharacterized protein YbjT (DUF2867 family)